MENKLNSDNKTENTKPKYRNIITAIMLIIMAVFFTFIGAAAGYYFAVRPFHKQISMYGNFVNMGPIVDEKVKGGWKDDFKDFQKAYKDENSVQANAKKMSWIPPNTLSPFISNGLTPGKYPETTINKNQCRGEAEIVSPKPAGVFRIFLTGGSTAYSAGAPDDNSTIGAFLQKYLNEKFSAETGRKFEVFTMANPGWVSTNERVAIENVISYLEPDLVVSLSAYNDIFEASLGKDIMRIFIHSDLFFLGLLQNAYKKSGFEPMPNVSSTGEKITPADTAEKLERNMRLAGFALSMKSCPYVFVFQPTLYMSRKELSPRESGIAANHKDFFPVFKANHDEIMKKLTAVNEPDLYVFDFSGMFDDKKKEDEIFLDYVHFGDRGYEFIGNKIAESIAPIIKKK